MENNFEKSLEVILNTDLSSFQEKLDRVKKINIKKTIEILRANGKTNTKLYKSLLKLKDIDFEEYQKSLDSVKKMELGLSKKISEVDTRISVDHIQNKKAIFISYSHQDSQYLKRLRVHLKPLETQCIVELWDDTKIQTGDLWRKEIANALENSTIAILLISADFLASDFITENELPPLLEKAKSMDVKILPVILKKCRFERDENLSQYQSLNPPNKPIANMKEHEQDELWDQLSIRIEEMI